MILKLIKQILIFFGLFVLNFLIFIFLWIKAKFVEVDVNLLIVNLQLISEFLSNNLINETFDVPRLKFWIIFVPLSVTSIIFAICKIANNKKFRYLFEKLIEKIFNYLEIKYFFLILFLILFYSIFITVDFKNFNEGLKSSNENDYFENIYQKSILNLKNNKSNLIVLTLESFDLDFLLKNKIIYLKDLDQIYNIDFKNFDRYKIKNFKVMPGSEYTLGSQVSILCGVPLKLTNVKYANIKSTLQNVNYKKILNNYDCSQDHLNNINYETEFVSNTILNFMGTKEFIENHTFKKIIDNQELIKIGYSPNPDGFLNSVYDGDLFDYILKRVNFYYQANKNFFIFGSTVETHPPGTFFHRKRCSLGEPKFNMDKNMLAIINNSNLQEIDKDRLIYNYKDKNFSESKTNIRNSFLCLINSIKIFLKKLDDLNISNLNVILVSDHSYRYTSSKDSSLFNIILISNNDKNSTILENNFYSSYDVFSLILNLTAYDNQNFINGIGKFSGLSREEFSKRFDEINKFLLNSRSNVYETLW